MIILTWNVRGLNSPLKQHEVATILNKRKVDVCALVEVKLSRSRLNDMNKIRFPKWNTISNANSSVKARIVVLWNSDTTSLEVLNESAQGMNIKIRSLIHQTCFQVCFVYGYNSIAQRRGLWEDLRRWSPNQPWLVLGDFNSVLSQLDRQDSAPVTTYEITDFHSCCMDIGLSDLLYSGCHFTWNRGLTWSKIDRVMANPLWSMSSLPTSVHFNPPGGFSDHSQMWVEVLGNQIHGRKYFKFFNMWTTHEDFIHLVASHWSTIVHGCPMFVLCKKLKFLKRPLKALNRLHFSHISERAGRAEAELISVQQQRQLHLDCELLLAKENRLRLDFVNLKASEQMYFSQKLKYKFLEASDKGSKLFHCLMNQRNRRNFIAEIRNENGELSNSIAEVGDIFANYFQHLLGSSKMTVPLDENVISRGPRLQVADVDMLLAPISDDDIRSVIFSIGNDKAPGPDGYSALFFKKAWSIVGKDVCNSVKDFFNSGRLLKQVNHSVIALIPKKANVSTPADFRPISCCNVIYKVISKLLSARLAHALQSIIGPLQNAFLGGRKMSNNVHLLQELLRLYGRKRASPRCMLKVDFKKAFDSVQWDFIRLLLLKLGFPGNFVHLVMACVETTSYSVSVNGRLFGHFKGGSGIRQGDPLSPYLFIACMEYFSRMLSIATDRPGFKFHPQCDKLQISHLAFADDVILLCRGDNKSVGCLLGALQGFGLVSGLVINPAKSSIYFGGIKNSVKQSLLQETNFCEGSFPFRYLGVPLSPHRLLASQFSPLLLDLESAIQAWMGKNLTYAGRLELLRSVLYGMANFWLSIFPIPKSVLSKIISCCRNFLWSGDIKKSHSALVAWKDICLPKTEGGLGILDLKTINSSFLVKELWDVHRKADSLWIKWISHYYLGNGSVWEGIANRTASPMWKAIISAKNMLIEKFQNVDQVVTNMEQWGNLHFFHNAYGALRPSGNNVNWSKVIWETWALPKHSFFLWLAIKKRLKTKDRLIFVLDDPDCCFCRCAIETHEHLFFQCSWTATLWARVRDWLKITKALSTLTSAVRYLGVRRNNSHAKMRRVALSVLIYLIWEERNRRTFDSLDNQTDQIFRRFQLVFYMIYFFHEKDVQNMILNSC